MTSDPNLKKDNTFESSYTQILSQVNDIKEELKISEEDDSQTGRKLLNIENHLEKIEKTWRQLKHTKEQLETQKLQSHVNNKISQEALKNSLKRQKVETQQKINKMESGYNELQKVYTNYIVGYETKKLTSVMSLKDQQRQSDIKISELKDEIKQKDILIDNLIVEKERLMINNNTSKELNLAKFQNKTGALGKEFLQLKSIMKDKKDKKDKKEKESDFRKCNNKAIDVFSDYLKTVIDIIINLYKDLFKETEINKLIYEIQKCCSQSINENVTSNFSNQDIVKEMVHLQKSNSTSQIKRPKTADANRQRKDNNVFTEELTKADQGQIYNLHGDKRKKYLEREKDDIKNITKFNDSVVNQTKQKVSDKPGDDINKILQSEEDLKHQLSALEIQNNNMNKFKEQNAAVDNYIKGKDMKSIDRNNSKNESGNSRNSQNRFLPRTLDEMLKDNFYNENQLPTNNFKYKKGQVKVKLNKQTREDWKEEDGSDNCIEDYKYEKIDTKTLEDLKKNRNEKNLNHYKNLK